MTVPVIVEALRTPIGKFNRSLAAYSATKLGAIPIKALLERTQIDPLTIDEIIMGCVLQGGLGQAPARQAAIHAGIPPEVGATAINKVCGSGLKSIIIAAQNIKAGDGDIFIAGGMESMTNAPYFLHRARHGYVYGNSVLYDMMEHDGLKDPFIGILMGETGEIIAEKFGITREMADEFALRSHKLAAKAMQQGKFKDQIVTVTETVDGKETVILDHDEGIRPNTSLEKLAKLKPVFRKNGIVTAGNASQVSDGAAAVLVMSSDRAEQLGLEPKARIIAYNQVGVESKYVMEAPIHGVRKLLQKTGLTIDDLDLVEHNEAFATASVAVQQELGIPDDKFNVNGGAVALGHPLGATGTRIVADIISELHRRRGHRGLVTICLGGGEAVSMILETDY